MRSKKKNIHPTNQERDFLLHDKHLKIKFQSSLFEEKLNPSPILSKFYKTIQIEENRNIDEFYSIPKS